MSAHRFVLVLAALAAGCSSINHDTAFRGAPGTAYALVAADGMAVNGVESYAFAFQRVDIATSRFGKETFSVTFNGMGPIVGDEFRKPDDLKTTIRFGGRAAPPGDYALISRSDYAPQGSNMTQINCFSLGAAVFRLREGSINIVPGGDVYHHAPIKAQALAVQTAALLAAYPNMTAPASLAEPIGSITFSTSKGWLFGNQTCNPKGSFTFTPRPAGVGTVQAQDVAPAGMPREAGR